MEATAEEVEVAKYPAYKDSGVNWLGEIPAHWEVVRSKALFQQRREQARKDDQQLTASQKYGIISQQEFMELEGRRVTQVEFNRDILKHIEENDFIISMRSFQGGIEYSSYSGCVSSAYVPLIPIKHVVPEYFKYLFKSDAYIQALSSTSNLVRDGQALRFENFSQVDLVIVPEEEQIAIAQFLEHKIVQIDKAIAIKEKQSALLKEYKQVFIHEAVTRGLNKEVQFKNSGVDWIGQIPIHWEVIKSKRLFYQRKERARKGDQQLTASQKYGIINQQEFMKLEGRRVTQVELNRAILKHVEANDFVISMRSFQGGIELCNYSGCVSSAYIALVPIKHVVLHYFKHLFKSYSYIKALSSTSNLVRDGQALRFENFAQVDLLVVPENEQKAIAEFIDNQSEKVDKAIRFQEQEIEKLKEYKASLINSAVTGKIKVC